MLGIPKLGCMHPLGYICRSEGVHLKLTIEGKNMFIYYSFSIIYAFISEHTGCLNNFFQGRQRRPLPYCF